MPNTRSQSKQLKPVSYNEEYPSDLDQPSTKPAKSTDSSSTYQPSNQEDSSIDSAAQPKSADTDLESYKRVEDRDTPPSAKKVRFDSPAPPVVSPRFTDIKKAFKQVPITAKRNHPEDYPNLPKFSDLLHLRPGLRSGLEQGFAHNFSCGPSVYRLKLGIELVAEIEEIDYNRSRLLEELGELEQVKRRKLLSIEDILETQREEVKISTLAEFEKHYSSPDSDTVTRATTTFDKFGIEVQTFDSVEVDNPFTNQLEGGTVKQVLPNNLALVRLNNSERVIGLFGDQLKSLE